MLDTFTTFGDLLKYLRIRAQLTQRELSIAVGYSEAQISRQESNKRVPSEYALKALFVPALGLEDDPATIARLLALAEQERDTARPTLVPVAEKDAWLRAVTQPAGHNLPRPLTSFIGREKEVEQVVRLVREHPLVTLTGAGGVGKTRLALQAADELVIDFPDGVWLVELAPVIDAVFVPIATASIFKVHSAAGERLVQTLRDHLIAKRLLLILDNCEHVIDAVAALSTSLLAGCPHLRVLATSREILNVEGEVFYRCPSLSLPNLPPGYPAEMALRRAAESEAVRLFAERAGESAPGFCLSEANARLIADICRGLDGIPLAIELAAARLRLLSLEQVAGYMDNIFGLIAGSRRSAMPRHKTLKALIEWSYTLLSPEEQRLLRRLSVFTGGWTLAAAEAVAGEGAAAPAGVLDQMQQLADKSLVFVETTEFGENRYRMLETIRQYGREQLRQAGEEHAARDRHLAFFAALAQQAMPPDPQHRISLTGTQRLMRELDNMRLALEWAVETDIESGLRLGLAFTNVVPFELLFEIGTWLERLLAARARQDTRRDDLEFQLLVGDALLCVAESSYLWGVWSRSEQALREATALFETIGAPASLLQASSRVHLGMLCMCTDPEQSRELLEAGREAFLRMGEDLHLAGCYRMLTALNLLTGQIDQARQYAAEDLRINQKVGGDLMSSLEWNGSAAFLAGDFEQAVAFYRHAQESGLHYRNIAQAAWEGYLIGCVALAQGDGARVLALVEEMDALGQETGSSSWFCYLEILRAMLAWTQGEDGEAARRAEAGLANYYPEYLSFTAPFRYVLGRVALARGDLAAAEDHFRQVDEMARAPTAWKWKAYSLHCLAMLAVARASRRPELAGRAAALFGAQERLFAWLPILLSPFEKSEYERARTMLKEIMGEEALITAWASGQAISYQQAFALAQEGT